jgi:5'-methylthioadenosine phosphorylase
MFGDPFSNKLNQFIAPRVAKILKEAGDVPLHTGKTVVCMEGEWGVVNFASNIC